MTIDSFTESDFKLAEKCRGPHDRVSQEVGNAAVKVAGKVEAISRDEGVTRSEAELIFCKRYEHVGFYQSVVSRCVAYDRDS